MGLFTRGEVVLLPFSYSDLSRRKIRPVLLVTDVGRGDWIVCQITSNPYAEAHPITIAHDVFLSGGLAHTSYLRPSKISTLQETEIIRSLGVLKPEMYEACRDAIVEVIRG